MCFKDTNEFEKEREKEREREGVGEERDLKGGKTKKGFRLHVKQDQKGPD